MQKAAERRPFFCEEGSVLVVADLGRHTRGPPTKVGHYRSGVASGNGSGTVPGTKTPSFT